MSELKQKFLDGQITAADVVKAKIREVGSDSLWAMFAEYGYMSCHVVSGCKHSMGCNCGHCGGVLKCDVCQGEMWFLFRPFDPMAAMQLRLL